MSCYHRFYQSFCTSEHERVSPRNLTALLFRLENSRTPQDVAQLLQALNTWLQLPGVTFNEIQDLQEIQSMLAERVKKWTKDWKQQGIEEGRQQSLREGMQQGESGL